MYFCTFVAARFLNKVVILLGEKEVAPTRPLPGCSQAIFSEKGGGFYVVTQLSYNARRDGALRCTKKNSFKIKIVLAFLVPC
jgi:hypothetical protein